MTHAPRPYRSARDLLPETELFEIDADADPAELIAALSDAAAVYWACVTALKRLEAMDEADRLDYPDFELAIAEAEAGIKRARYIQQKAQATIDARNCFLIRWRNWPERRALPRHSFG